MTFQREILSRCPACTNLSATVIETRYTKVSTRRRKECRDCGYKFTTHEVSEEYFQAAKTNCLLISRVKKAVDLAPMEENVKEYEEADTSFAVNDKSTKNEQEYNCHKCAHMMSNECTLGIPEFNTDEANECVYFITDENNLLVALGIKVPAP